MPMTIAILKVIAQAVAGWAGYGFCPIEASVENWGVANCARPVVVLNNACIEGCDSAFLAEFGTRREALAYAQKVNLAVDYIWRVTEGGDEVPLDVLAGR